MSCNGVWSLKANQSITADQDRAEAGLDTNLYRTWAAHPRPCSPGFPYGREGIQGLTARDRSPGQPPASKAQRAAALDGARGHQALGRRLPRRRHQPDRHGGTLRSRLLPKGMPLILLPALGACALPLIIATALILLAAVPTSGQEAGSVTTDGPSPDEASPVEPGDGNKKECTVADCRTNFQATLFIGSAIDNFAASNLQEYLNPDASGDVDTFERLISGLDFGYRLRGNPANPSKSQLWVYGKTAHGVRSTDINCQDQPRLTICQDQLMQPDFSDFTEQFRFALRNASSLEAAVGLRWEFLALHAEDGETAGTRAAARLYFAAQAGFLAVSDDDDDALDEHALALGAVATNGKFQGSYLQIGYGPSDLFDVGSDRWKIDAMLTRPITKGSRFSFFSRITANVDAGNGADSVQSYFGFGFDLTGSSDLF